MDAFWSDIRLAIRGFAKAPGFAAVAILTLALGIGGCTAIFSVVNGVLLQPLPYAEPQQLVLLREINEDGNQMNVPEQNFKDWLAGTNSYQSMGFYNAGEGNFAGGSEPVRVPSSSVSAGFFDVLRVRPLVGRALLQEDFAKGAAPVAVVSHALWQRVLASNRDLNGLSLRSFGYSFAIVGVMPPGFSFPARAEVWMPSTVFSAENASRSAHNWRVIARLRPGVSLEASRRELSQIAKRIHGEFKDVTAVDATVLPLQDAFTARIRPALMLLLGAVAFLLLIACANVANMLLARATAQEKEFAVRAALGASRTRLVRQCVTESLLLALAGAGLGAVVAAWGVDAMMAMAQGQIPRSDNVSVNGVVLGFALGLAILLSAVLGLIPGWRTGRLTLVSVMNEGGRGGSTGGAQAQVRNGLVVIQVALTLVLLVGAGLLARSFGRVMAVDLGFQRENRIGMDLRIPRAGNKAESQKLIQFVRQLEERIAALPGVMTVGGTNSAPLSNQGGNGRFLIEGRGNSGDYWPNYRIASPGYFSAVGIPLLRGRIFDATDGPETAQVAVVSRDLAEKVFPGEDPIGLRINTGNMDGEEKFMSIVGVVGDVRDSGPENEVLGAIYVHYLQRGGVSSFTWVIRAAGNPSALTSSLQEIVRSLNPELAPRFRTLEELFSGATAARQFNLTLLAVFAGVALALAALGIYGVLAYSVEQRTREIGIRMALGAQPGQVVQMVIRQGGMLVLAGVGIGLLGAIAASRLLTTMLFQTSAVDPGTYGVVALFLCVVAVLACVAPARHAAQVDPLVALRHD